LGYKRIVTNSNNPTAPKILPFQMPLRPALPVVLGNVDYTNFEALLRRMDAILVDGGIDRLFLEASMERFFAEAEAAGRTPTAKAIAKHQECSVQALRTMVLKAMLGEKFRGLSRRLAECALFREFCRIGELERVKVPGKSALQRYALWLPHETMRTFVDALTEAAAEDGGMLGLANALEMQVFWWDSTVVKANIHFPVDWVLLRDAARTLVKAILLIRRHGLRHRIGTVESFLGAMNALCMAMAQSARRKDGKRRRKAVLREMKKLVDVVARHGRRYRQMLAEHWAETDWSQAQAERVLERIDSVLGQLPAAKRQAHERIIGERQVPNAEKILSLYESDVQVVVRGKAGAAVEFGNSLLIAEQADGLIVDYELSRDSAPADSRWLEESLGRVEALCAEPIFAVVADRGFDSRRNGAILEAKEIVNGICPKSPQGLAAQSEDEVLAGCRKRRAQTEGRIAILRNRFLGGTPRSKGFGNRELEVDWAVLTHNLWVLARLETAEQRMKREAAKAA